MLYQLKTSLWDLHKDQAIFFQPFSWQMKVGHFDQGNFCKKIELAESKCQFM